LTEDCIHFYQLTPRETEVTQQFLSGLSNKEIAHMNGISLKTAENHIYNLFRKMDVNSRMQLVNSLNQWERTSGG